MRIPVSLLEARSSSARPALQPRKENKKSIAYIAIIIVAILTILAITFLLTHRRNKVLKRHRQSKTSEKLPSIFNWKAWRLKRPKRNAYSTTLHDNGDNDLDRNESREMSSRSGGGGALQDPERAGPTTGDDSAGVDRHTSVRSVMTLPAYSPAARENERILAREGERGGIDTVVEFPEAPEEEEARREGEMESLYQIRLARRREAEEREARRQARREARARGDTQALAEIRRRAEAAAEESLSQQLIAEHQMTPRDRRVSSVQYGDLGVARHDGTRLRANSSESDNRPLLDSAASISGQSARSRAISTNTLQTHYRGPSVSSIVSSRASDDFEFPEPAAIHLPPHSRNGSISVDDSFEVVSLSHQNSRSRSASRSRAVTPLATPAIEIDIPAEEAPAYEDPPDYQSPVERRGEGLERLPSIQITTEPTPVDGRGSPGGR